MEVPVLEIPAVVEAPVIEAPVIEAPVIEAPVAVVEPPAPVEVMDGGAKHSQKAKRRYSPRRKSASKRSSRRRSSRSRKMRGGEFGVDAFGRKDLGQLPKKKNFPYSGATRNDDYDAINKYLTNPAFTGAESAYEKLAMLHKQMKKANLSPYDATRLLEEVKAYDQTLKDGSLPQWIIEYANGIDEKIKQTEAALALGDDNLAASYEWQAAIEEKKLAYMIMEALSGVAVGSGEDARSWRKDRTEGYTSPLGWETGFSGASSSGPASAPASGSASGSASGREQFLSLYNRNISKEAATRAKMQLAALDAERLAKLTNGLTNQVPINKFLPVGKGAGTSVFTAEEQANQFPGLFQGGKKHKRSRSRSRCHKGKVFDRDTKRCRNPKSKGKSKSRSKRMGGGGGKKCSW